MSVQSTVEAVLPSQAVVEQVAAIEDVEQTELAPLFEDVDPEALDALVESGKASDSAFQVEFTYHGHEVTVDSDGVVHIDTETTVYR